MTAPNEYSRKRGFDAPLNVTELFKGVAGVTLKNVLPTGRTAVVRAAPEAVEAAKKVAEENNCHFVPRTVGRVNI